jgi:hypothetical protein
LQLGQAVFTVGQCVIFTGHFVVTVGQRVGRLGHDVLTSGQRVATVGQTVVTAGQVVDDRFAVQRVVTTGQVVALIGQRVVIAGQSVGKPGRIVEGTLPTSAAATAPSTGGAAEAGTANRAAPISRPTAMNWTLKMLRTVNLPQFASMPLPRRPLLV